jgi:serine/threonine-protein kinase
MAQCAVCGAATRPDLRQCPVCAAPLPTLDETVCGAACATLPAGVLLDRRYRIERTLGRGGMGLVYLALDLERDGAQVALKVLPETLTADAEALARLRQEATLAMRLSHPNVVRLHNLEGSGERKYLVMEFVDGGSLSDLIAARVRGGAGLAPAEVMPILEGVAAGVDYAHRERIIHRDIKPANVLVAWREGKPLPKVADFGIAREIRDLLSRVSQPVVAGTPAYMAPEQFRGERIDGRADVYSVGATIYHLLAAAPPFSGGDLTYQILERMPDPVPGVPPAVMAVVHRAMAKSAASRYPSCAGFLDDFRGALERSSGGLAVAGPAATLSGETMPASGSVPLPAPTPAPARAPAATAGAGAAARVRAGTPAVPSAAGAIAAAATAVVLGLSLGLRVTVLGPPPPPSPESPSGASPSVASAPSSRVSGSPRTPGASPPETDPACFRGAGPVPQVDDAVRALEQARRLADDKRHEQAERLGLAAARAFSSRFAAAPAPGPKAEAAAAWRLVARIRMALGGDCLDAAADALRKADGDGGSVDPTGWIELADEYGNVSHWDSARKVWARVWRHRPAALVEHWQALVASRPAVADRIHEVFSADPGAGGSEGAVRLARALVELGRPAEATAALRDVREPHLEADKWMGIALAQAGGEDAAARRRLESALAASPRDPEVLATLGVVAVRMGDIEPGKRHLEAAGALAPASALARRALATGFLAINRPDAVLALAERWLATGSVPEPWLHHVHGRALEATGQEARAEEAYRKAIESGEAAANRDLAGLLERTARAAAAVEIRPRAAGQASPHGSPAPTGGR